MPQIVQLPYIFASQLFWLAVVFGIIFFVIGRGMLPKIQSTVELREKQIADDLERAQAARSEAEETEAAWRARMDVAGRAGDPDLPVTQEDTTAHNLGKRLCPAPKLISAAEAVVVISHDPRFAPR